MSKELKRCKQCGILKDVEEFRQYTYSKLNSTPGRFSLCKECEALNTRYRRLVDQIIPSFKESMTYCSSAVPTKEAIKLANWEDEVRKIEELYELLESRGLHTPLSKLPARTTEEASSSIRTVDKLLDFYASPTQTTAKATAIKPAIPTETKVDIPAELQKWLDESIDDWIAAGLHPEYLQETVYESLKAKYRPQIGIDPERFIPIYDDTYKDVLNAILRKFDDYEEAEASEAQFSRDMAEEDDQCI